MVLEAHTMNSISSISLSGVQAARLRLDTAANNVANIDTPDFRRQQTLQQTLEGGGVQTSVTQSDTTGSALETDIVEQMAASYTFKANLGVIQTEDRMMGSLIDLKA
jgi:flagellar hook protein FlgE